MGSQRFCLRWNNHQSNLLSVFDQLLHDEAFVDVTLAVEGQFLRAHKMVLSACSPYFQALFVGHPDKHPIVILKDVPYTDMRSLLDFMYRGEVSVDQDRLTAFLKVAESLRIKGLTEVNEERCDLPTIANSLLNQALPPPPPPNLHRIQQQGPPPGHQSPHHMPPMSKRPHPHQFAPNPMLNSALTAPKRKRGRPRKLSGGSPGTPGMNCEVDGEEPKLNNLENHLGGGVIGEHLVVKPVAPPALPKQLTILNANPPPTTCSPHGDRALGSPRPDMSPATVQDMRGDTSEPQSPVDDSVKPDDRDDDDGTEAEGDADEPSPDTEHETDEYNHVHVKMEDDPRPSTSGQENMSPYQQQQQQHAHQQQQPQQNSASDGEPHYPPSVLDSMMKAAAGGEIPSDCDSDEEDEESLIVDGFCETDCDVKNNNDASAEGEAKPAAMAPPADDFTEPSRPAPQRRRVRRRTTSNTDPAEALTEMSVRGLNLFRYASITEGVYKCMECAKADVIKTFKNKYSFQRHAFLYHEGHQRKVFPCPVCSKEFSRPDKMKNHMKMVHDCFMPKEVMFPPVGYYLPPTPSSFTQHHGDSG